MFRSYLQRPKDVVFEGLSESFGYGGGGERKKKMKKKKRECREKLESLRV